MLETQHLNHIKSLDGIRGMAVLLVIFFHSPLSVFQLQFGWVGVNLFLILSGFLITRILVNQKTGNLKNYLASFYIRRFLKIVPVYFLYLLIIFCFLFLLNGYFKGNNIDISQGVSDLKRNYAYLFTFTFNFGSIINFLANNDYHNSVFTGHLWSVSVEQQFYILFPFIVYYLPVKYLKRGCVFLILFIPVLRLVAVMLLKEKYSDLFWIGDVLYSSTVFQLDTLSVGACIALYDFKQLLSYGKVYLRVAILLVIIVGLVHTIYLHDFGMAFSSLGFDIPVYHLIYQSPNDILNNRYCYSIPLLNITFGLLILLLARQQITSKIFINNFIVFVGKISYSVYIWHLLLSFLVSLVLSFWFIDAKEISVFYQVFFLGAYLIFLFFVAWMSYRYVERRFLQIKVTTPVINRIELKAE